MKLGIIGCGHISQKYFDGAKNARNLKIVACADLKIESARARATEHGCRACTVEELLADTEVELVINLTIPLAHIEIGLACIEAGKHVYSEKPFAVDLQSGRQLIAAANEKNLRVGCAPDTFLFGSSQTSRKLIDDGWIGKPIGGIANMITRGHESWHPNPSFYYDLGGGPMMDMGPYYLHALVNFLGPIQSVSGYARKSFEERIATSEAAFGQSIPVKVPTHYAGAIEFQSGAIVMITMSFDVAGANQSPLQIFGSEGTLFAGDPNQFNAPPEISRRDRTIESLPQMHARNARIIGVIDMVNAIRNQRPHRANGENALHVLEAMLAFEESERTGARIEITSPAKQPLPLPTDLPEWETD